MALTSGSFFLATGAHLDAAVSAVEADAIFPGVVFHSRVVDVVTNRDVDSAYRLVVVKVAVVPAAAFIAVTKIAVAIADATVETDFGSPVAFVEDVVIAIAAPVARSPEIADFGSRDPGSGDPIIIFVTVSPVAGGPDVAVFGTNGLLIDRQFGWSDPNRYSYTDLGGGSRRDG